MKIIGIILTASLFMPSMLAAQASQQEAGDQQHRGFYIGAGIGASEYDDDNFYRGQNMDSSELGGKIYGGYRFNQYLGVEAALVGLGSFENSTFSSEIYNDFGVVSISGLGTLPLAYGLSLYGQLGFGLATVTQDITYATANGQLFTRDDDSDGLAGIYGGGILFIPSSLRILEFRLGWEHYDFSVDLSRVNNGVRSSKNVDTQFDLYFFGVAFNFW